MKARLLAVVAGVGAALVGSALWRAIVPEWGSSVAIPWLTWVREVGLAEWGPANVGGIVFCVAGTVIGARLVGITRPRTLFALAVVALGTWIVLSIWLFMGVRLQDVFPDPTGG